MKIRIKNIPEGYKVKGGELIQVMKEGGTTNSTLPPVDRDKANIEAEKNETVLTDADQDGFFELYNIGGKRHTEGGTPLNLPEQSFIFSDTRKMLLTKDEMGELGIESKKRITPAAASKKFPINKYIDILKDESSDKIAITSAEAMIKKNKIKLSHLAFIQEKKKNFSEGLPLASYPYLLENGIDPQEFEAKLQQQQGQQGQGPQQGQPPQQGMPPQQGQPAPGGQPSPEQMQQMMAMGQSQGAPQGPPQQGPPQGMPPQGAPQGGGEEEIMQQVAQALQQGAPPEEIMQQLIQMGIPEEQAIQLIQQIIQSIQGQQGSPQGMPPQGPPPPPQFPPQGGPPQGGMPPEMMAAMQQGAPQGGPQGPPQGGQGMPPEMMEQMMAMGQQGPPPGMARYGGHPLNAFVYGGDLPKGQDGPEICPCSPDFTERTGLKMHPSCCGKTSIDDKNLDFYRAGFDKNWDKSVIDETIGNTTIDEINRMDNAEKIYNINMLNRYNPSNKDSIIGDTTTGETLDLDSRGLPLGTTTTGQTLDFGHEASHTIPPITGRGLPLGTTTQGQTVNLDSRGLPLGTTTQGPYANINTVPEYIPSGPWDKTFTDQNELLVERYGGDLPYDKLHNKAGSLPRFQGNKGSSEVGKMDQEKIEYCKNNICEYEQWIDAYRLKNTEQIKFMYESYLTKAIDKMKASGISTEIMPGHENNPNFADGGPLTNNAAPMNIGQQIMDNSGQGMNSEQQKIHQLTQAQRQLLAQREQIITTVQTNPEKFNNQEAQAELSSYMNELDTALQDLSQQLQFLTEQQFLQQTTIPLHEFVGETSDPARSNNDQYFNPDALMRYGGQLPNMVGGGQLPKAPTGVEVVNNNGAAIDDPTTFTFKCSGHGCSAAHDFGMNIPNITDFNIFPNGEAGLNLGLNSHNTFYNVMGQESFQPARDAWVGLYKQYATAGAGDWANAPAFSTEEEMFNSFNMINNFLNQAKGAGLKFVDKPGGSGTTDEKFERQMKEIAKQLGMTPPTLDQVKQYQGMYNALAYMEYDENIPQATKDLLKDVTIKYGTNDVGAHTVPGAPPGTFVTNIDGWIGNTTADELIGATAQTEIIETVGNPCTGSRMKLKLKECMEKGQKLEPKSCTCIPDTPVKIPEIPPYLTFPGDDLKVAALASIQRDKEYGMLEKYDPIMRDPGYVDDRAQVAAITGLANQALGFSRNVDSVNADAQDKIDQAQANRWATNTKIFDNTQAYNVNAINQAKEKNAGYMQTYQDMVNTVDQEYDNTQIADMMNLTDAEISRMDNADKLYELNMRNPNYYFDPQKHSTIFQNPEALEAFRNQNKESTMSFEQAVAHCRTMGFKTEREINKCAENMVGGKSNNNNDIADRNINNNDEMLGGCGGSRYGCCPDGVTHSNATGSNCPGARYGGSVMKSGGSVPCKSCNNKGTIRERDLIESKIKLRNWIMGS